MPDAVIIDAVRTPVGRHGVVRAPLLLGWTPICSKTVVGAALMVLGYLNVGEACRAVE